MVDSRSLRGIQFFSDMNDEEMSVISRVLQEKEFKKGTTVFKEGEQGQSLYVIKKGEVKACRATPEGDLMTLTLHKDGEIFGEMSFLDAKPRSATIVAIADTKVYVLEKSDFETLVDHHPRLIYKMLKNIVFSIHFIVKGMNTRYIEMINYMWGRTR